MSLRREQIEGFAADADNPSSWFPSTNHPEAQPVCVVEPVALTELCDLALQALDRQWIAVGERLPERAKADETGCVNDLYVAISLTDDSGQAIDGGPPERPAHYDFAAGGFVCDLTSWYLGLAVSHWTTLPPPPSQQGEKG